MLLFCFGAQPTKDGHQLLIVIFYVKLFLGFPNLITPTAEISANTQLDPIDPAATDVTKNGKKMLLTRPIALQNPDPDNFADVGHISGTYTADA